MNNEYIKNNKSVKPSVSEERKNYDIDITELASLLLSRMWIIIFVGLVAAVGAFFYTSNYVTPKYQSTARVYILNRQNSSATSVSDLSSAASLKEDFQVLVKSNEVYRQVLDSIGEDSTKYKSLGGMISLDNNTSRFVDITVTDIDPVHAKILVDAVANVSRLKAKDIMGVEDITIEEYGTVATTPSSPNMKKNIILAVAVGIILACAIIITVYLMNDNIRTAEDIESILDLCVLGSIPDVSTLRNHKQYHCGRKRNGESKNPMVGTKKN